MTDSNTSHANAPQQPRHPRSGARAGHDEIAQAMMGGITFKGTKLRTAPKEEKVKTKAKKKTYITGLHGSGSAKMKADIRRRRANRHKNK
ncbi:MAG: hypothetical protein ACI353_01850 [Alloprevotella sp.]